MKVGVIIEGPVVQNGVAKTAPNGGTAEPLQAASPTLLATRGVIVQAAAANTLIVRVGGPGLTTAKGIELAAGQSVMYPVADPSKIYCVGMGASQVLNFEWV